MEATVREAEGSRAVPERLQRRDAERREEVERRRQEKEAQAVQEEKSGFFVAAFARERESLETLLEREPGQAEPAESLLEEAAGRLQGLQRLVTDSVRFLAPYEVRQAQGSLARLQGALAERRLQLQPKKRFAFRARRKETAAAPAPKQQEAEAAERRSGSPSPPPPVPCGFSGAEGQTLELGPAELLQRDVLLTELSGCRVLLRGNPNTLRVRGCRGCTLLCGPISTSAMVQSCSDCRMALACQQLRTHHTQDTHFYVQVTSRAIVEDCTGVRFAPYTWSYPGIEGDFETSGLDRDKNHWDQVDDFNWLSRDEPSPNWSILPEEKRVTHFL